jgi:hypothetical protein
MKTKTKTKTKTSLILWAVAALYLSFWAVKFAMTGEDNANSKALTFVLSYGASLASAVCGAGFMQQWIIAKKK